MFFPLCLAQSRIVLISLAVLSCGLVPGAAEAFSETPAPTPTPRYGCRYVVQPVDEAWMPVMGGVDALPGEFGACVPTMGSDLLLVIGFGTAEPPGPLIPYNQLSANLLLRWEAPILALEGEVVSAVHLEMDVEEMLDEDGLTFAGDWFDWSEDGCDESDHVNSIVSPSAIAASPFASVPMGQTQSWALLGIDEINFEEDVYLRLAANLDPNDLPTGYNGIGVAASSHPTLSGPRLVLTICDSGYPLPSPTPTPPPGCRHVSTSEGQEQIGTLEEWMTVAHSDDRYAPAPGFVGCIEGFEFNHPFENNGEVSLLLSSFVEELTPLNSSFYNSGALLAWDTTELGLEPNEVVVAAWLRARLRGAYSQGEKHLVGEWYDWPEPTPGCDESDHAPDAIVRSALSIAGNCGARCVIANMEQRPWYPFTSPGVDHAFQLDDPDEHINRGGLTYLRLHLPDEPGLALDIVNFAGTHRGTPTPGIGHGPGPQLDLLVCDENEIPELPTLVPFSTPTPTVFPTATPTIAPECTPIVLDTAEEAHMLMAGFPRSQIEFNFCEDGFNIDVPQLSIGSVYYPPFGFHDWITLLRWDTSQLEIPVGMEISRAGVEISGSVFSRGRKSIVADWYDWHQEPPTPGPATPTWTPTATVGSGTPTPTPLRCDSTDYDPEAIPDALSSLGTCGRNCIMKYMFPAFGTENPAYSTQFLELDNFAENISLTGDTYLRIFGKDETGFDPVINRDVFEVWSPSYVADPNDEFEPNWGPKLVVIVCRVD